MLGTFKTAIYPINIFDTDDAYLKINNNIIKLSNNHYKPFYLDCTDEYHVIAESNCVIYYNFIINGVEIYNKNGLFAISKDGKIMNYIIIDDNNSDNGSELLPTNLLFDSNFIKFAIKMNDLFILFSFAIYFYRLHIMDDTEEYKHTFLSNLNKKYADPNWIQCLECVAFCNNICANYYLGHYYEYMCEYKKMRYYYNIVCNLRDLYTIYDSVLDNKDIAIIKTLPIINTINDYDEHIDNIDEQIDNIDDIGNLIIFDSYYRVQLSYGLVEYYKKIEKNHAKIVQFYIQAIRHGYSFGYFLDISIQDLINEVAKYYTKYKHNYNELIDLFINLILQDCGAPVLFLCNYYYSGKNTYRFDEFRNMAHIINDCSYVRFKNIFDSDDVYLQFDGQKYKLDKDTYVIIELLCGIYYYYYIVDNKKVCTQRGFYDIKKDSNYIEIDYFNKYSKDFIKKAYTYDDEIVLDSLNYSKHYALKGIDNTVCEEFDNCWLDHYYMY